MKNENVNSLVLEEPVIPVPKVTSHKVVAKQTQAKKPTTHEDQKIALALSGRWFYHIEYFSMKHEIVNLQFPFSC